MYIKYVSGSEKTDLIVHNGNYVVGYKLSYMNALLSSIEQVL